MKVYTYVRLNFAHIYEIARTDNGGNMTYRAIFSERNRLNQRVRLRAAFSVLGPAGQNECQVDIEDDKRRAGARTTALRVGHIISAPAGNALGTLMLYHVLREARRKYNVDEFHVTDGEPGRAFWLHLFEGVRIENVGGDVSVRADYRSHATAMMTKLQTTLEAKGWECRRPEVRVVHQWP